jgi:hypothetical protein
MTIVGTSKHMGESGIFFPTWDALAGAMKVYDSGRLPESYATEDNAISVAMENSVEAGFLVWEYLEAVKPSLNSFLNNQILDPAKKELKDRSMWHGSWDYNAMGTRFFKSSVTIKRVEDPEGFILGINAAYIGSEGEEKLAQMLKLPRAVHSVTVYVELERGEDGMQKYDISEVLEKLAWVFKVTEAPADYIETLKKKGGFDGTRIPVAVAAGIVPLVIEMDLVGCDRWQYDAGTRTDTFQFLELESAEGEKRHIIKAPPGETYSTPPELEKPRFMFRVMRLGDKNDERLDLIPGEQVEFASKVADDIVAIFSK